MSCLYILEINSWGGPGVLLERRKRGHAGHLSPNGGVLGAGLPGHIRGHNGHEVYKLGGETTK